MYYRRGLFVLLLAAALARLPAQTPITPTPLPAPEKELPQWVKDLRRWEIITFGSFPFTMFTATFAMDMYRWSSANGLDFSDAGRRYAPWPLKSAGAIAMEGKEMETTITIAAGLSIAIAVADLIIVQVKRNKAKKMAESLPVGSSIIIQTPLPSDEPAAPNDPAPPEAASPAP